MSIHQLTTLAGTASKPYLLRGNQQVTDQIHYGAAPAAGRSRAGMVSGMGGLWGKRAPAGTRAGITSLGDLESAYAVSNFLLSPGKGIPGGPRTGHKGGWVPTSTLSLLGAWGRQPRSLSGKGHLMPPEMSALERRDSLQMDRQQLLFVPKSRSWGKSCPCIRRTGYFPPPLKFCLALVGLSFQIIASKIINLFLRLLRSRHLARFSAITKAWQFSLIHKKTTKHTKCALPL